VTYAHEIDYTLLFEILVLAAAIIGIFLLWNRRLSKEVARRIQTEIQLQEAKQRAESADHLKSAFLATMSHELRTPLNSIIGFTGILLKNLAGPLNAEQTKQLNIVKNAGQHLLDLINDVLDISKIEAGQLELRFETVNVYETIEKCVKTISPLAEKKHLELKILSDPTALEIESDRRRVEQVLINLLNNAIKFTEHGGVYIRFVVEKSSIRVSIRDTGIGIKAGDLSKLFKAFSQIDTGISRQHEGTGLGLSISKKLIDMLGGKINVESEWGRGSTFSFTLPLEMEKGNGENSGCRRQSAEHVPNTISVESKRA
jgi:signal transduction histidine kinase